MSGRLHRQALRREEALAKRTSESTAARMMRQRRERCREIKRCRENRTTAEDEEEEEGKMQCWKRSRSKEEENSGEMSGRSKPAATQGEERSWNCTKRWLRFRWRGWRIENRNGIEGKENLERGEEESETDKREYGGRSPEVRPSRYQPSSRPGSLSAGPVCARYLAVPTAKCGLEALPSLGHPQSSAPTPCVPRTLRVLGTCTLAGANRRACQERPGSGTWGFWARLRPQQSAIAFATCARSPDLGTTPTNLYLP